MFNLIQRCMKNETILFRSGVISMIILLVAASRLLPHPPNFAPLGAMALFGAAYYDRCYLACVVPVVAAWLSDLAINNVIYGHYFDHFVWLHSVSLFVYGAFVLVAFLGTRVLRGARLSRLVPSVAGASVIFFLVSNLGTWLTSGMYPLTGSGLAACYVAGVPFFWNTLGGDAFYTLVMFGGYAWVSRGIPALRPASALVGGRDEKTFPREQ